MPRTFRLVACVAIATILPLAADAQEPMAATPAPVATGAAAATAQPPRGFLYRTISVDGQTRAYCVFVPPAYTPDRPWPTILFLHGSGERGADGFLQTEVGIGKALRRNHAMIPAIVVMPQCPPNAVWTSPESAKLALECVEAVSRDYNVDGSRLYLTGLSLGGRGAWYIAARTRNAFAAIVPVCGGGDPKDAAALAKTPIWAWHGTADKNVPMAETERMVDAVEKSGGSVQFTKIPQGEHAIWDRVYNDPKLWQWLFAQQRGGEPAPVKSKP